LTIKSKLRIFRNALVIRFIRPYAMLLAILYFFRFTKTANRLYKFFINWLDNQIAWSVEELHKAEARLEELERKMQHS